VVLEPTHPFKLWYQMKRETIKEYLARGGVIQKLPPEVPYGRLSVELMGTDFGGESPLIPPLISYYNELEGKI